MKKKSYACIAAAIAALTFSACGDDNKPSNNGGDESAVKQVNRVDDLGGCNKNKFGEIIYVAETDSLYECTGKGWVATDSSALENLIAESSSSESDEDDSSDSKSSSSFKTDSSDVADVETVKVDSVTLKGFAQKGPFASGTAVTVYGLDSLLEKTKTKFTGKVAGDSGAFKVEGIALPSQFALVEVSGFFKSEVSGKNTSGTKTTLSAIVDLSEGKSVKANVNLFTTLEYARVKHLVAKDGFNVPAAKKRATTELLAFFGAKASDDLTATSISLDTTAAGEALLTASVMLVGDLSASKFGSRLSDVADLFAESGIVADEELLVGIADWASKVDSTDNFESIRKNVKEMKLFETVPDFDGYIYKFWTAEYKLGACTDSLEETIKKNDNKKSDNYGMGYACTSKRWHKSTALDTDLGLCTGKMEGSFKEYKGGKSAEYYVCRSGTWNKITETQFELKECTEERDNEYVMTTDSSYFVCSSKQWTELDADGYELRECNKDRDQKIFKTKRDNYYKCASGEWEKSDKLSYEMQDAGACTDKNNLDSYETESLGLYVCRWSDESGEWVKANALEEKIGVCGSRDNPDSTFKQDGSRYYVCLDKDWTETDATSFEVKRLCDEANKDKREKSSENNYYICQNSEGKWTWNSTDFVIYELGLCQKSKNDSTMGKTSNNRYWHCAKNQWESISDTVFTTKKFCNAKNDSTIVNGYACVHTGTGSSAVYSWRAANAGESATGAFCVGENKYKVKNGFACNLYWRAATDAEKATGEVCHGDIKNQISNSYVCALKSSSSTAYDWRAATEGEVATGKVCNGNYSSHSVVSNGYVCMDDSTDWRKASDIELATGRVCLSAYYIDSTKIYGTKYICSKSGPCASSKIGNYCWHIASTLEQELQVVCYQTMVTSHDGYYYSCENDAGSFNWRKYTTSEETYGVCRANNNKDYKQKDQNVYECNASTHTWSQVPVYSFTNTYDGYTYRYMRIADYDYMIDNMKIHHDNDSASNWWCYENKWENCEKHGMLYTWTAVLGIPQTYLETSYTGSLSGIQGACPAGWRVPTEAEIEAIRNSLTTGQQIALFNNYGSYTASKWYGQAYYWVADEHDRSNGRHYAYSTYAGKDNIWFYNAGKKYGYYLRCIR